MSLPWAGCVLPYRRVFAAETAAAVPILGNDGRQLTLSATDIQDLKSGLRGELITASSPDYDAARRLWIPTFDRRPALIVRCAGAGDVKRAVSFAAAHGLLTAVRGGGHSLSGQSGVDNGLVIDVSPMRLIEVDPIAKRARVASGSLLGQMDMEFAEFGLATTAGTVADTGVAGLTLGGGVGRLARKFGLSCDNVTGFELVTADGRWQRATAAENPDLYWALRGGGGNFGVVTSFEFALHELAPVVYGGTITYPFDDARGLLRAYAEISTAAPDELDIDVDLQSADNGGREVEFSVCYCGPQADAERVVAPLRKLGKPTEDKLGPASYLKLQGSANMPGHSNSGLFVKGGLLPSLTPASDRRHGGLHRAQSLAEFRPRHRAHGRGHQPGRPRCHRLLQPPRHAQPAVPGVLAHPRGRSGRGRAQCRPGCAARGSSSSRSRRATT